MIIRVCNKGPQSFFTLRGPYKWTHYRCFRASLLVLAVLALLTGEGFDRLHARSENELPRNTFQLLPSRFPPSSRTEVYGRSQIHRPEDDLHFQAVLNRFTSLLSGKGQYMVGPTCTQIDPNDAALQAIVKPYSDHPNSKKFRIQDCLYFDTNTGLTGRVIMLNPDADRLARWTISACNATTEGTTDRCLIAVTNNLWCPSNAQFPISGAVTEDGGPCKMKGGASFAFRDGVTVKVRSFRPEKGGSTCIKRQLSSLELTALLTEPPLLAAQMVRLANANESILSLSGIPLDKLSHTPTAGKIPYLETSRTAYLEALGSDEYSLLSAWAKHREATGFFDRFNKFQFGKKSLCGCFNANNDKIQKFCK